MIRLIVAIIWLLLIVIAMLSPGNSFPEVDVFSFQDKVIHLICFGGLSYLWCGVGVNPKQKNIYSKRIWINFLIFGVATGVILEYLQLYIPYRSFDYMDLIANNIGGVLGLLAYFKIPTSKIGLD